MIGFAMIIGACKISPASPAAALILLGWLYGVVPGQSYEEYRQAYSHLEGPKATARVERCFATWPIK